MPAQANLFRLFVYSGGHLITFCPDKQLGDIVGLSDAGSVIKEGYLKLETDNPLGKGIAQERDGIIGIRAAEMFLAWTDPALTHLNQAGEQMHLLSNMIEGICASQKPLPRLWYFPGYSQCLILLTDNG